MEDLVIIVPTYNRQNYLKRVIRYYSLFPCKVFICDSSKEKADVETSDNIIYRWVPQSTFYQKILDIINETSVDFYALSPDDDFLKEETLLECYKMLKGDQRYSIGTGGQVFFNEGFSDGLFTKNSANRMRGINDISFDSHMSYVKYFEAHYQNIHWSVFRKNVIETAFQILSQCNYNNARLVELTLSIEGLREGRVYVSSNGLNYREIMTGEHWGTVAPPITKYNIKYNDELKSDIKKFQQYYKNDGGLAQLCLVSYLDAWSPKTTMSIIKRFTPKPIKTLVKKILKPNKSGDQSIVYEDALMTIRISNALADD